MSSDVKAATNWDLVHGTDLCNSIAVKYLETDKILERDELFDIVSDERAILLKKPQNNEKCELTFTVKPIYNIVLMTIISDYNKIEIFSGTLNEYYKTLYADFIDDFEGTKTYRFDIQFVWPLNSAKIKFFNSSDSLWIYGIQICLNENTSPIEGTISSEIDMENVTNRLTASNIEISEKAEKCKQFLETYKKLTKPSTADLTNIMSNNLPGNLMAMLNANWKMNTDNLNGNMSGISIETNKLVCYDKEDTLEKVLKNFIDEKFKALEEHINEKFKILEDSQNEKFEKILFLLNKLDK